MSGEQILKTTNLKKSFNGLLAVDDVSWELTKEQTMGILGPNGAGKSTFFNLIVGALRPTAGSIYFKGEDITGLRADKIAQRGLAKTFQTNNLFEGETVVDNLKIAAQPNESIFGIFRSVDDITNVNKRANEIIDLLELSAIKNTVVNKLSHGDQRKVEIAVALATDPDVVLLDEPTSGVSNEEMEMLQELFLELVQFESPTFVIIEHNVDFLMGIVDEVTVLHNGHIIAKDTPESIVKNQQVQRVYLT